MRRFINSIVFAGLSIAAAMLPASASAQSLDQILGVVSAGSAFGYNSCSYVRSGFGKVSCQANRASNVARTLRSVQQRSNSSLRQSFDSRNRQIVALQRACKAGDQQSCARSGGTDPRGMTIARELMNACTAGDKPSCSRAKSMMDPRNVERTYARDSYDDGYAQPARYEQDRPSYDRVAQQTCRPVVDPRTGYRVAGQLVCR